MRFDVEIQAGKTAKHPIEGRYLYVVAASGEFSIAAKGVGEIHFGAGGQAEIPAGVNTLEFRDKSGALNTLVLESTDVVKQQAGEQVEVVNAIDVQRIVEPITVEVTSEAVFAPGSEFGIVPPGSLLELADVDIPSGSGALIAAANSTRKRLLFTITAPDGSTNQNKCRVGGPTVAAGKGYKYFAGNGAMATGDIEVTGAVHIFNEGQDQVQVSITEVLK